MNLNLTQASKFWLNTKKQFFKMERVLVVNALQVLNTIYK